MVADKSRGMLDLHHVIDKLEQMMYEDQKTGLQQS
jgi:hypothetical protein